jgi:NAD(P)-dependent dehydrogenase (short-subunit alcohol dehydrogenase family)
MIDRSPPPYRLDGKVALVTGASRGVGAAAAVALGAAGCRVACAARSTDAAPQRTPGTLEETVGRIEKAGGQGLAVPTNLAEAAEVERMVRSTVNAFGRLDILVNNAAVTFIGDLEIPMHRHDLIMEINLRAPFIAIRAAVPLLRQAGGGRIVNVSSVAALHPVPGLLSYGVSKIGLEHLTVDLAPHLQADGIAVNCFRIDIPVASEGFLANSPDLDHSTWEPSDVAAEGILWMLRQPTTYSGHRESMFELREREGIMVSQAVRPYTTRPPTELWNGLAPPMALTFKEPYQ